MSSPRDALSAISSAVGVFLGVFGIAFLFLFGRFPGGDEMVAFAFGIVPYLEYYGTEATPTPAYCTELLRIVVLLVDEVDLIEDLLCFRQADPVLVLDVPALRSIEFEPHRHI